MKTDKRILMLINEFPPIGESGVQRPLKFVKYLVKEGWQPYVVTPALYPKSVLDFSLLDEVPASVKVYKTLSLGIPAKGVDKIADIRYKIEHKTMSIKGLLWRLIKIVNDFVLPLDKQMGWIPFAFIKAVQLIQVHGLKNVYITGYPFSAFVVGILLKKIYGAKITLVSDYRDAWQFEPLFEQNVLPFRQKIIRKWDDRTLKYSDHIVFVTDFIRDRYCSHHAWLAKKASVITNGYDEDDFVNITPYRFDTPTLLYMGKIYSFKPSPLKLLQAISDMPQLGLQCVHIGTLPDNVKEQIENNGYDFYHFWGYKSHKEALNYASGTQINLLLINDDPESEGVLTGKVFELIRLKRPILALGPIKGVVKDLIENYRLGQYAHISDVAAIKSAIENLLQFTQSNELDTNMIQIFSRQSLTRQLIKLYEN